jgi:thioredoxin reductase (NADPH)
MHTDPDLTSDVLVIGAGPAGCTAALYAARAGLRTVMLSPTELSGLIMQAPNIANWPGQTEPIPGRELLPRMRAQALAAGAQHLIENVVGVDFAASPLQVYAGAGVRTAQTVIVATGATGRTQKAPGEAEFQGRGVCYCVACDGPLYADRDVLVIGGDAEAAEEALALSGVARFVTLAVPTPELDVDEQLQQALQARANVAVERGLRLEEIIGDALVTGAVFAARGGARRTLNADGIFMYLRGTGPAIDFLGGALATDGAGFIITDELCRTNIPGVFAAGDVRSKLVRQIVVAAAEGAIAALVAERLIRKSDTVRADRGAQRERP